MRKSILLSLLILALFCGYVYADATATTTLTPKSGKLDFISGGAVAVTDQSNGYTQRVDSAGAASVMEYPKTAVAMITDGTLDQGVAAVSSACRLNTITFGGPTSTAGDYLLVYDNTSATGEPVFDISIGTAKSVAHIVIPGGVTMSTGVFVKVGSQTMSDNIATITYDN